MQGMGSSRDVRPLRPPCMSSRVQHALQCQAYLFESF